MNFIITPKKLRLENNKPIYKEVKKNEKFNYEK